MFAARGNEKSPQNPSHRMIPQPEFNLWKPSPSWENLKNPQRLSPNEVVTSQADRQQGLFPQQMAGFPSLRWPLWLLQIKGPQLLFPSRLLYNPQQVTAKPGPNQTLVQLRLPSRATDNRDSWTFSQAGINILPTEFSIFPSRVLLNKTGIPGGNILSRVWRHTTTQDSTNSRHLSRIYFPRPKIHS